MSNEQKKQRTPNLVYCNRARYRYVPVQETVTTEEQEVRVTYGISVRTVEEEIAFVRDVSTELEEIQALTDLCTEKQLDPLHLPDVIEDFLADPELTLA